MSGDSVRAVVSNSCGADTSVAVRLTVTDNQPPVPATVLTLNALGPNDVDIRWTTPESGSPDAESVWVYYGTAGFINHADPVKQLAAAMAVADTAGTRQARLSGLAPETKYFVSMWISDVSGNVAPADSDTVRTAAQGAIINPVVVRAQFIDSARVGLTLTNFDNPGIPVTPDPFKPYVDTVGVWYAAGGFAPAADWGAPAILKFALPALIAAGEPYADTVALPVLAVGADSVYYFAVSLHWKSTPAGDSVPPFSYANGDSVLMRDTAAPANPCVVWGEYPGSGTTATVYVGNTTAINPAQVASVLVECSLSPLFDAVFSADTVPAATVVADAADGRYGVEVVNAQFDREQRIIYCSVQLVGANGRPSARADSLFTVGRPAPVNPVVLTAAATGPDRIRLSWNALSGVDSVRIAVDTVEVPLGQLLPAGFLRIERPSVAATSLDVTGLNAERTYYFAAQVNVAGLWSDVTAPARASATTREADTSKVTNTIVIDTIWFDSTRNRIGVTWTYDAGSGLALEYGVSLGLKGAYVRGAVEPQAVPVTASPVTSWIELGSGIVFDTAYIAGLWLREVGATWSPPVNESEDTVRTPEYGWQTVSYFPQSNDTVTAFNGRVVLWNGAAWKGGVTDDTVRVFNPAGLNGFMQFGVGFSFAEGARISLPAFNVGIRFDQAVDIGGYSAGDLRIYRRTGDGIWLVDTNAQVDAAGRIVWVNTRDLADPFILMLDIQEVSVAVRSDTAGPVEGGAAVRDTIAVSDNVGNVRWKLVYGKGGEAFGKDSASGRLSGPAQTLFTNILPAYVTDDAGVRAWFIVSDGVHRDTVNISRRVIVPAKSDISVEAEKWVPLRTTVELDDRSLASVLTPLLGEDREWEYGRTVLRVFRWFDHASNAGDDEKWVEYSDDVADDFSADPGRLMWIKTGASNPLDFGTGITPSLKDTFTVRIAPRSWCDLALPFKFNIRIGDILDATGPLQEYLQFYLWGTDPDGRYQTTVLYTDGIPPNTQGTKNRRTIPLSYDARSGYAVYNQSATDTVVMRIPPTPTALSRVTDALNKAADGTFWHVAVRTEGSDSSQGGTAEFWHLPHGRTMRAPLSPSFAGHGAGFYDRACGRTWGFAAEPQVPDGGFSTELAVYNRSSRPLQVRCLVDAELPAGIEACAGDGRDVIGALAAHPRKHDVSALLVDLDAACVRQGRDAAAAAGLEGAVEFTAADATDAAVYAGRVPARVVVAAGVFGNVEPAQVPRLIDALCRLCAKDGFTVWTRHILSADGAMQLTMARKLFRNSGFEETGFDITADGVYAVCSCRHAQDGPPLPPNGKLFEFTGYDRMGKAADGA